MKCKTCGVDIPGPNGKSFYGTIGVDGVQCQLCAVAEYKAENLFWNIPVIKEPCGIVSTDCAS